jgi:multidrug efflux pump subunit AcrA (membrane-fusion protein)
MILRIIAIVGALAAAALYFIGQGKLAEQQAATEAAEQTARTTQAELDAANETIVERDATIAQLERNLGNEKSRLENARAELATARQEVRSTQRDLANAESQVEELESTTRELRSDMLALEQSIASANQARTDLDRLRSELAEVESQNEELMATIENLRGRTRATANTGANASQPDTPAPVASVADRFIPAPGEPLTSARVGPETTIATVSADSGLIALANTSELGLSTGAQAKLVKDLKALGSIQVVRIDRGLVIADILPGANTASLTPGTTVQILR